MSRSPEEYWENKCREKVSEILDLTADRDRYKIEADKQTALAEKYRQEFSEIIHIVGVWGLENNIPVGKTDKLKQSIFNLLQGADGENKI
jgi:arginine decarboxylase-like protein